MTKLFKEETQAGMEFPMQLTEKYRPHTIARFVGLSRPKAILSAIVKNPRPAALLLIGPPGAGKTTMALAMAQEMGGELIHVASTKLTVDAVAEIWERVQYHPFTGKFWVVVADEADRMSSQAQTALLSLLDSAATLRPKFGGGFEQGKPLPVIWIFTCNGRGEKQIEPPDSFEKRFLSRCMRVQFDTSDLNGNLSSFLLRVWEAETKAAAPDVVSLAHAAGGSVRDALQSLEMELLIAGVKLPHAKPAAPSGSAEIRVKHVSPRPSKPAPAVAPAIKQPPAEARTGSMFSWADGYGKVN